MINSIIDPLWKKLNTLPYIDVSPGLVTPATRTNEDGTKQSFPISCTDESPLDCQHGLNNIAIPTDTYKSLVYIESLDAIESTERLGVVSFNTSVNLVAWFNVPKYGLMDDFCTSQSYFSNLLFKALNFKATSPIYSMTYTILSDISTFNNPFERWSYDYQRVTLPPYTYVHLIIGITGKISAGCIPDYDPLTQDYCVEL